MSLPVTPMLDEINRRALRPQSIHMDIEASAGAQHPQQFLNGQLGGVDVMEDAVGIDVIEAAVRKGKLAHASTSHRSRLPPPPPQDAPLEYPRRCQSHRSFQP